VEGGEPVGCWDGGMREVEGVEMNAS
jgi:hypothetical protein